MRKGLLWVSPAAILGAVILWSAASAAPVDDLSGPQRNAVEQLQTLSNGFVAVAELVTPSVVTITGRGNSDDSGGFFNDPNLRRFFGDRAPQERNSLGSGVIIRENGYILTNNHVVAEADEIVVTLNNGDKLNAAIVGRDPGTDLAVLRVERSNLPAAEIGDSDAVRIGEWVLAVGSPFSENLSTTVTTGIVSAKGRSRVGLNNYEDYIQTDAAINPGNSGGALVNLQGEVIGINTGIVSRNGGSNGIGFSIPSRIALDVIDDLIEYGSVTRGYLGVSIQDLDQDMAEALGVDQGGILIQQVVDGTPAG